MKRLKISQDWWNEVQPEGLPYPTSTLISGPGGSGKPLIGFAFVQDWLKSGGNVLFIPLQYPETSFVKKTLKELYDMNVEKYPDSTTYVRFDPDIEDIEKLNKNKIKANLLKPEVWDKIIEDSERSMSDGGELGTLVFASALNLLLFSPTYKEKILDHLKVLLRSDKDRTYLFNVSTSAMSEDIREWEEVSDNLMFARMGDDMKLYLKIKRVNGKEVSLEEIHVPIEKEMLTDIKDVAEGVRKRRIPKLKNI